MGIKHENIDKSSDNSHYKPVKFVIWFVFLVLAALSFEKVVEWVEGTPRLADKHRKQLEKHLAEIEDAEQYALKAEVSGWYDCILCPGGRAFLNAWETWKYGVTRKGENVRYSKDFLGKGMLRYEVQFRGDYAQCLIEEKRKLFN